MLLNYSLTFNPLLVVSTKNSPFVDPGQKCFMKGWRLTKSKHSCKGSSASLCLKQ